MTHRSGANRGEPRDYCFVEYCSREVGGCVIVMCVHYYPSSTFTILLVGTTGMEDLIA